MHVSSANGFTFVEAAGGSHEYTAGHPDLPWLAERVDLPAGMKVTGVEKGVAALALTSADEEFDAVTPWPADRPRSGPSHPSDICSGLKSLAGQVSRQAETQFVRFQVQWSRQQQATRLGDALRRLVPALESPHVTPSPR